MALLNEKRNRIPLVATLPVDGDDNGIRGQMRMKDDTDDGIVEVCTVSDQDGVSTLSVSMAIGSADYTSVGIGDASEAITIEHATGGVPVPVVTVVGNIITVTGDATTTIAQIITVIDESTAASALVTVVDSGTASTLTAQSAANMAGGAGTKAAKTLDTSLVVTALSSGRAGNDITLTVVDGAAGSLKVVVDGKAITITCETGTDTTAEIAVAINASTRANKLVSAVGGGEAMTTQTVTPLTGGASLAVWLTLTAQ